MYQKLSVAEVPVYINLFCRLRKNLLSFLSNIRMDGGDIGNNHILLSKFAKNSESARRAEPRNHLSEVALIDQDSGREIRLMLRST